MICVAVLWLSTFHKSSYFFYFCRTDNRNRHEGSYKLHSSCDDTRPYYQHLRKLLTPLRHARYKETIEIATTSKRSPPIQSEPNRFYSLQFNYYSYNLLFIKLILWCNYFCWYSPKKKTKKNKINDHFWKKFCFSCL